MANSHPGPAALAPRKRPRQRRSAATVETILDGAARILEAGGLDAFNTNAVAARAGVSVGSLYQYFPGKDAVMAALVRRDAQGFAAAVEAAVAPCPGETWRAAVDRLIDVVVAHQLDSPRLARILDFEEARLPLDAETAQAEAAMQVCIAGVLVRAGDDLAALDIDQAAGDLLHIARALTDAAGRGEGASPRDLKARVRRAALGYLGWSET